MGEYKVPQNVEAEDKILGPLSMKQFVYALIGLGWGFLTFAILKSVIVLWVLIGIPPAIFGLALGLYQREDQSLETFIIAVVEFFTRPKLRFWQKEPIAEVFHLNPPPPKPELPHRDLGKVESQLQQLTVLMDSHGWATRPPALQESDTAPVVDLRERLGVEGLPFADNPTDITEADDILSPQSANAQGLNLLMENTEKNIREEARAKMQASAKKAPAVGRARMADSSVSGSTASPSGDIVKLATEGGDLTVAQIAARARQVEQHA